MKSDFDPATEAKIRKIKKLMEELPTEACAHVVDNIFAGCVNVLAREYELAGEIGRTLEAEGAIILLFKDNQYRLETGHVDDASDALVETLDAIRQEINKLLTSNASEKGWIH
jgi:hypothetical protein